MAFELGQVKVGAGAFREQRFDVMEEVQAKIEDAAGDRPAIDQHVLFYQVPATRAYQQRRNLVIECVLFALRAGIGNRAIDGIAHVDLSLNGSLPCWGEVIFKVGHEYLRALIQRIDDHVALDRSGDLYAPILQVWRNRRNRPLAIANMLGFGQEIRQIAGIEFGLPPCSSLQQFLASVAESAHQGSDKSQGIGGQYFGKFWGNRFRNFDTFYRVFVGSHGGFLSWLR